MACIAAGPPSLVGLRFLGLNELLHVCVELFSEANQISKRGSFYLALFVHLVELFRRSCWISLSVIECAAIDFLPSLASF